VLVSRVKTVLRRNKIKAAEENDIIQRGELIIHPGKHEVTYQGKKINLTFLEFRILSVLARRPGWVMTRYQIVDAAQGDGVSVTDRSVDVHIVSLRKKLGKAAEYIDTVRGVGYRFREDYDG